MTRDKNDMQAVSPRVPVALQELDAQQSLFVTTLLELGGGAQHAAQAAYVAGYGDDQESASRAARILLKSPKILKAIKAGVVHRFDVAVASAVKTLLEICDNTNAPANARISAAQEILNRSSIGPIISRNATVQVKTSVEDLLKRLQEAETAGKISDADVVEGEFEVVAAATQSAADVFEPDRGEPDD